MKISKKIGALLFFILTRLGVAIGILICLAAVALYLFVPQLVPVSLKLSSFDHIVMPQIDNCEGMKQSVATGSFIMPPLTIVNKDTLVNSIDILPKNKTFQARIQLENVNLKIQDVTDRKFTDLGEFNITKEVEFTGKLKSIYSGFDPLETPETFSYFLRSKLNYFKRLLKILH